MPYFRRLVWLSRSDLLGSLIALPIGPCLSSDSYSLTRLPPKALGYKEFDLYRWIFLGKLIDVRRGSTATESRLKSGISSRLEKCWFTIFKSLFLIICYVSSEICCDLSNFGKVLCTSLGGCCCSVKALSFLTWSTKDSLLPSSINLCGWLNSEVFNSIKFSWFLTVNYYSYLKNDALT